MPVVRPDGGFSLAGTVEYLHRYQKARSITARQSKGKIYIKPLRVLYRSFTFELYHGDYKFTKGVKR
jgi:hypothetical protein